MELREHQAHSKDCEEIVKRHHQHVADRGGEPTDVHPTDDGEDQGTLNGVQCEESHHKVREER